MNKVLTQVTVANVNGALHQFEGIIINVDDGKQYSFVPLTRLIDAGNGDQRCSGTVTLMENGQFTHHESGADLYLRKVGTPDAQVEIDILSR